jgi:lysozyme
MIRADGERVMAKVSEAAIAHIKSFEGLSLEAYPDAGHWSIGYGHSSNAVYPGMRITDQQADALLRKDLEKFELGVERVLAVPATQEEFDAMVALAYNIGLNAFEESTLLRHHNNQRHQDAAAEFGKWTKSGNTVLPGLVKRREKEAAMYRAGGRAT